MPPFLSTERGTTLVEVLVTLIVVAVGLLGLAGLQLRLQSSEVESYQRSQALMLLSDMSSRIVTNRLESAKYPEYAPLDAPVGAGMQACPTTTASSTRAEVDVAEWCNTLQGAAEKTKDAALVGALTGGRGCIERLGAGVLGDRDYRITVAWQGLTPTTAPVPVCGEGLYNGDAGSSCKDDRCRRVVTTTIRIANLK